MELSVVVCCSDDFDLAQALDSIDEDVEIIVSITPNVLIEQYLRARGIQFVITPRGNHAVTTNAGLAAVSSPGALIIDSDTQLLPGTIRAVSRGLDQAPVVNVPVLFEDSGTAISRVIARARDFDNRYDAPAYKPGIAFRMDLIRSIGGYWYDPSIYWPCDAEMLGRLRTHRIDIFELPSVGLAHRPIPLRHVLLAYFHYGVGDGRRAALLNQQTHWNPPRNLLHRYGALIRRDPTDSELLAFMLLLDSLQLAGIATDSLRRRLGEFKG